MTRLICVLVLVGCLMSAPKLAYAMDIDVHFAANKEQWVTEVWYEHNLLWQIAVCYDGVVPASTNQAKYRTLVVPEFEDGFFGFKIR